MNENQVTISVTKLVMSMWFFVSLQAWNLRLSGGIHKLFDPSLCDESQLKEIKRCMEIGLLCTQNKPSDRPTMPDVLEMLQGKKKVPTPKQPGYIKRVRAAGRYKQV